MSKKSRATFNANVENGVLFIEDLNQGMSVTNDIENVLADIHNTMGIDVDAQPIVYRDSQGDWDGIKATGSGNPPHRTYEIAFIPLRATTKSEAGVEISKKK